MPSLSGHLLIALGSFSVGAVAVVSKMVLKTVPPDLFLTWLFLFALPLSFPFRRTLSLKSNWPFWRNTTIHVAGSLLGWHFFAAGLKHLDAPSAAFIGRLEFPVLIAFSAFYLKEKKTKGLPMAVMVSMLGLFIMTDPHVWSGLADWGKGRPLGVALIFISVFGFATGELGSKRLAHEADPRVFTFLRNGIICSILLSFCMVRGKLAVPELRELGLIAVCALMGPVLARTLFMAGLKRVSLGHASVIIQLEPLMTLVWALFLGTEIPGPRALSGGFIILLSCLILIWPQLSLQALQRRQTRRQEGPQE